jgi:two-component system OmpR family response regulator
MPINMLYVDDDDSMRSFVELACRDPDFIVTTASTGQEALILAHHSSFDLILLDVVMPGLDGPATLELLRAQEDMRSTLIAFLTAHTRRVEIEGLQLHDVVAVLAKPFNPRTLAERLRSLVKAKSFYHATSLTSALPE